MRHPVLFGHHDIQPPILVSRDRLDHALERLAPHALGGEYLTDLLALALGMKPDFELLEPPLTDQPLVLRPRAQEVRRRHAEPVRDQVRQAQDDDDARVQPRALHARDDGQRRHRAVDRAVDEVAKVILPNALRQALSNRLDAVRLAQLFGRGGFFDRHGVLPGGAGRLR